MPETSDLNEEGFPNTERALTALESWRYQPKPKALGIISAALSQLTTSVLATWDPLTSPVLRLALDPSGEWIAAAGKTVVTVGRVDSKVPPKRLDLQSGTFVKGMALSNQGQELLLLTQSKMGYQTLSSGGSRVVMVGGEFRRLRVSDWSEITRIKVPDDASPLLSSDGEWLAISGKNKTDLIPTNADYGRRQVKGRALCFVNGLPLQLLAIAEDRSGKSVSVSHYLEEKFSLLSPSVGHALTESTKTWLESGTDFSCSINVIANKQAVRFIDDAEQSWQPIPFHALNVVFSPDGSTLAAMGGGENVSHLFPWPKAGQSMKPLAFFNGSTAVAFGSRDTIAAKESEEPRVYILQIGDPRLLWDSHWQKIPKAELAKFEGLFGYFEPGRVGPWEFDGNQVLDRATRYPILNLGTLPSQGSPTWVFAFSRDAKALRAEGVRI